MPSWLTWTFAALVAWGLWAVVSKEIPASVTPAQSQAWSTLGMLPIFAPLGWAARGSMRSATWKGFWLALAGGLVTCLGNVAYYDALARGGKVATVVSLTALYPLVTIVLAMVVLRERLSRVQLLGVGVSMVAIWLFNIQREGGMFSSTVVFALLPVVFWGLSGFLQKVATNHLSGEVAALVYLGAFVPVAVFFALREPWPAGLSARTWLVILVVGFLLAFGNLAIVLAFARGGKAAVITPLASLYPLISVSIAVLVLGEKVGGREMLGIACALVSVIALSFERRPVNNPPAQSIPTSETPRGTP